MLISLLAVSVSATTGTGTVTGGLIDCILVTMAGPLKKLKSGRDGTQNSKPQRQQNFASAFAQCPVCSKEVPRLTINFHVDECLAAQDSTRRPHGSDAASQALVPGEAKGDVDATASPDAPALMLSLGGRASCSHSQPSSLLINRAGPVWPMFASGSSLKGPYVIRDAPLLTCFGGPNRLVCVMSISARLIALLPLISSLQ